MINCSNDHSPSGCGIVECEEVKRERVASPQEVAEYEKKEKYAYAWVRNTSTYQNFVGKGISKVQAKSLALQACDSKGNSSGCSVALVSELE
jgi:hypothetical protein